MVEIAEDMDIEIDIIQSTLSDAQKAIEEAEQEGGDSLDITSDSSL